LTEDTDETRLLYCNFLPCVSGSVKCRARLGLVPETQKLMGTRSRHGSSVSPPLGSYPLQKKSYAEGGIPEGFLPADLGNCETTPLFSVRIEAVNGRKRGRPSKEGRRIMARGPFLFFTLRFRSMHFPPTGLRFEHSP